MCLPISPPGQRARILSRSFGPDVHGYQGKSKFTWCKLWGEALPSGEQLQYASSFILYCDMRLNTLRLSYPNPSSFLKLVLIGFALAILPLLFAFGNAALYLDRLAEQSRNTVYQAVEATRASRVLSEQLTVMERSVRQYSARELFEFLMQSCTV